MIKKIVLIISLFLISTFANAGDEYIKTVFPKALNHLVKDYRVKFTRLSGLESSPLHWDNAVVIYCTECISTYKHNHKNALIEFDDEDEYDEEDAPKITYRSYKPGTVFLKEHFVPNNFHYIDETSVPINPKTFAVMIKENPGYDPDSGDWHYYYFTGQGKIIAEGKASNPAVNKLCGECHSNIKNRDFIFSRHLRSMTKK